LTGKDVTGFPCCCAFSGRTNAFVTDLALAAMRRVQTGSRADTSRRNALSRHPCIQLSTGISRWAEVSCATILCTETSIIGGSTQTAFAIFVSATGFAKCLGFFDRAGKTKAVFAEFTGATVFVFTTFQIRTLTFKGQTEL
jgi:hypothetical protein